MTTWMQRLLRDKPKNRWEPIDEDNERHIVVNDAEDYQVIVIDNDGDPDPEHAQHVANCLNAANRVTYDQRTGQPIDFVSGYPWEGMGG